MRLGKILEGWIFLALMGGIPWIEGAVPANPHACAACGGGFGSVIYQFPNGNVCEICHAVNRRCTHCGLPAVEGYLVTPDGRFICRQEKSQAVLQVEEARKIFAEVRSVLSQMFGGTLSLKHPQVHVAMFDVDYWNYKDGQPVEKARRTLGVSTTRRNGDTWAHNVMLWSGQLRPRLRATCAHEYMHLWINENLSPGRKIQKDTLEGICELVAFKAMQRLGQSATQETILDNTYTRGAVDQWIAAEEKHGMFAVLAWVREGRKSEIDLDELAAFGSNPASRTVTPRPEPSIINDLSILQHLKLQGITLHQNRRVAMINNHSFARLQSAAVRAGGRKVTVRCMNIQKDYVLINIAGNRGTHVLRLKD